MAKKSRKSNYQTRAGRERRQHILETTKTLLLSKKIGEVSLKDIALEANIPLSSMYNLFKNLDAIHLALVDDLWEDLLSFRTQYLRETYPTFKDMVVHSSEVTLAFIHQSVLVKKIIYSDEVPAAIKSADQDLLVENIRTFVTSHLPSVSGNERQDVVDRFRRTVVVFDALVMDSISRHGTVPKAEAEEVLSVMAKMSE